MLTNRYNRLIMRVCTISGVLCTALLVSIVAGQAPTTETRKPEQQSKAPQSKTDPPTLGIQPLSELPLEELLERALSRNPAIRKAQVELAEAQVALDRARQEVARDVTAARMAVELQRLQIEVARSRVEEAQQLNKLDRAAATAGADKAPEGNENAQAIHSRSKVQEATVALRLEHAKLSELESRLQYETGEGASPQSAGSTAIDFTPKLTVGSSSLFLTPNKDRVDPSNDPNTAVMRKQLTDAAEKPVTLDLVEMPLADAIIYLADLTNIRFVIHEPIREPVREEIGEDPFATPITLSLGPTPFHAALTALQDQAPRVRFVLRPYGILITAERGEPSGSMTVEEFYRQYNRGTTTNNRGTTTTEAK